MATFQSTVIVVFGVILIVCLLSMGYMMYKKQTTGKWPPNIGECPDYWVDLSGNGSQCVNTKNLGTCPNNTTMDFTVAPYNGADGSNELCEKKRWAQTCGLTWDGITSGVIDPCDVSGNII